MSIYRLLQDHYIANQVLQAGTIQSTADVGGLLPVGWKPTPNVDPLDTAAVTAFYAQGPALTGSIVSQWQNISVAPPATYWRSPFGDPFSKEFSPEFGFPSSPRQWFLTGLGAALAPINE